MHNNIKLLCFDLDGTILNNHSMLSYNFVKIIRKLQEKGLYVMIVTGGTATRTRKLSKILEIDKYLNIGISFNGSIISDIKTNAYLYECKLNIDSRIEKVVKIASKSNVYLIVDSVESYDYIPYFNEIGINKAMDFLRSANTHQVVYVNYDNPEFVTNARKELSKYFLNHELSYHQSMIQFLDITEPNVSKGKAIDFVINRLNISKEQVMVFGDGWNDISMFEMFENSVCLQNGVDDLKKIAKYTTPKTNDQDGVADFLSTFFDL